MNKLFTFANSFGNKDGSLYPLFEELDGFRGHFQDRKKEIEELITILNMRVEAEQDYAYRLLNISASFDSIRVGMLAKEIDAFKADCHSKGKAA